MESRNFASVETCQVKSRGRSADLFYRTGTSDRKAIQEVWERNTYEKPRKGFSIERGEAWIDGGANIGAFSRLVLESGATCKAYEPDRLNYSLLSRNCSEAELVDKCITLHGGAVTLNVQQKPLQQRRHSIVFARRGATAVSVNSDKFSDAIESCDGCKLNIEGAEVEILRSRPSLGGLRKLVFEWSFDVEPKVDVLRGVLEWLSTEFVYVTTSRRVAGDVWKWYPPNVFVHCWGRR